MKKFQDLEKWRRPELFLAELLSKSVRGELWDKSESVQVWHRAIVSAVDVEGGKLENPDGAGSISHLIDGKVVQFPSNVGPLNPRNSIKARVTSKGFDQLVSDDDLKVFWPLFPEHDMIPVKPGEHVYVTFEDDDYEHGLWLGKVSGHSNVNFFRGEDAFKVQDKSKAAKFGDAPPSNSPVADKDSDDAGRLVTRQKSTLFGD